MNLFESTFSRTWRIQGFPNGMRGVNPCVLGKNLFLEQIFAEKCMKMKEIGLGRVGILAIIAAVVWIFVSQFYDFLTILMTLCWINVQMNSITTTHVFAKQ